MNNKINFVFWGTPDVASETLEILKENGFMPSLIITSPDKPQGRKMVITPPPVKVWAIENKISYLQPEILSGKDSTFIGSLSVPTGTALPLGSSACETPAKSKSLPDLFLVVAYGKIIPEDILNIPKLGSINIHYSLLPKYRGASPVESAILNGDTETGISIQKMEYKMDTGPIIAQEKVEIGPDEKAPELRKRLIKIGGELLVKTLPDFIDGKTKLIPQSENEATYCKKIKKEDGLVDLEALPPSELYNKFRAYATWPRTFFFKPARNASHSDAGGNGKRIIITDAKLENGEFKILKIIPEGGKETKYEG
ncbi:MAG: methionyl-tRNA formyltransferase [Candidatus Paceibacterota bacterium]|jgi:methionyl-tRNA formyltransferase